MWDVDGSRYGVGVGMSIIVDGKVVASRNSLGTLEHELPAAPQTPPLPTPPSPSPAGPAKLPPVPTGWELIHTGTYCCDQSACSTAGSRFLFHGSLPLAACVRKCDGDTRCHFVTEFEDKSCFNAQYCNHTAKFIDTPSPSFVRTFTRKKTDDEGGGSHDDTADTAGSKTVESGGGGDRFAFEPAPADFTHQAYRNTSTWSWGGGLIHDEEDSRGHPFHLFAEVQTGGCGVSGWQTNGKIVHGVSKTANGPYAWADDALPVWHTGPHIMRATDGMYLLWAMGTPNASVERPCVDGSPVGVAPHKSKMRIRLHSSQSLDGPWTEVRKCAAPDESCDIIAPAVNPNPVSPSGVLGPGGCTAFRSPSNSSVLTHQALGQVAQTLPNGTVIVMAGGENTVGDYGVSVAQHWRGPYVPRKNYILFADQRPPEGTNCSCCFASPPAPTCCDKTNCFAWSNECGADPRGVANTTCHLEDVFFAFNQSSQTWFWLAHQKLAGVGRGQGIAKGREQCEWFPGVGGYAESKTADFFGEWTYDFWAPAYGLNTRLDNGTSYCLDSRERPKLFMHGNRSFLTNSACPGHGVWPGGTGCFTWLQEFRRPPVVSKTDDAAGYREVAASGAGHKTDDEYDDFHYPLEEPKEMASVTAPTACAAADGWSIVFDGAALCVLERSFKQWGLMALLDPSNTTSVRLLRKSIGELQGIAQPRRNFTADYIKKSVSSLVDYPAELALGMKNSVGFADGELSFGALAQQLAPPRDITEISLGSDVVKFVVSHSGRVKCAGSTDITEVQNLSAPLPAGQKVVFDPSAFLSKATWPAFDFENQKSGLLGGHRRIANLGAYSAAGGGFELIALADASFHTGAHVEEAEEDEVAVVCNFSAAKINTYIVGCPGGGSANCKGFHLLALAKAACQDAADCGGVTFYPNNKKPGTGMYQLRGCGPTGPSGIGERSYLKENCTGGRKECTLPRLPNINYSPAVYVRMREQAPGDTQESGRAPLTPASFRYYHASNSSAPVNVSASEFYANLGTLLNHTNSTFDSVAASLRLPGAEGRRQRDQALSGLLLASNNYVGNQANYGDGLPYWSVARQDNGSLALIPTTVDDALLDFGLCDTALAHIGFWLDNYLTADGQINYFTWGGVVDGVGDIGRVASLFLKARRQCASYDFMGQWAKQHEPALLALGRRMLVLKAAGTDGRPASTQRGPRRPECKGLVAGCPEADWSHFAVDHSPDNETWFAVNLWLQRGIEEIGEFLPLGDALGAQLRGNNSLFRAQIAASVAASVVPANSSGFAHPLLLPPFARKRGEFAVFKNMTTDVRAPIEGHDLARCVNGCADLNTGWSSRFQ